MKRVFIGGSNDGERLDDLGGLPVVAVIKKQKPLVFHGEFPCFPNLEQEWYRRETIVASGFQFVFYVERTMSIEDAIQQLINGYKANTEGQTRGGSRVV